jgi:3,4-dihydroxy 2-butanone 4-phosphate synthase/GTP cyclohydrolase II
VTHGLHHALLRGAADAATPALVRVHALNPLADALHWRRADFGPAAGEVMAAIAAEGAGALVLLGEAADAEAMLARIREEPGRDVARARGGALAEWRRTGVGSQILADLGLGKLRVIGSPRKQVGVAGFGLEVVEYVELPPSR